jgi:hypothetical protein
VIGEDTESRTRALSRRQSAPFSTMANSFIQNLLMGIIANVGHYLGGTETSRKNKGEPVLPSRACVNQSSSFPKVGQLGFLVARK